MPAVTAAFPVPSPNQRSIIHSSSGIMAAETGRLVDCSSMGVESRM